MKKYQLLFLLFLLVSCNKQDVNVNYAKDQPIDLSKKMNSEDDFPTSLNYNIEELFPAEFNPSTVTESQAEAILEPLLESGQELHETLLQNVVGTQEWNNLTIEERYNITHLNDQQLIMLSVIYQNAA